MGVFGGVSNTPILWDFVIHKAPGNPLCSKFIQYWPSQYFLAGYPLAQQWCNQRKGNYQNGYRSILVRRGAVFCFAGMWILPSFFPPKTAPKSKVWRGHLRRGSQDFIDYINELGNFRGISGLIHPDQAVFHWEF